MAYHGEVPVRRRAAVAPVLQPSLVECAVPHHGEVRVAAAFDDELLHVAELVDVDVEARHVRRHRGRRGFGQVAVGDSGKGYVPI